MQHAFAMWQAIAHVSELTGVSVALLAIIGFAVWSNPLLLRPALAIAAVVVLLYVVGLHEFVAGDRIGKASVQTQLDQAKRDAQQARDAKDGAIRTAVTNEFTPQLAALQKRADALNDIARENAKSHHPPGGAKDGACRLGDRALQLRQHAR